MNPRTFEIRLLLVFALLTSSFLVHAAPPSFKAASTLRDHQEASKSNAIDELGREAVTDLFRSQQPPSIFNSLALNMRKAARDHNMQMHFFHRRIKNPTRL